MLGSASGLNWGDDPSPWMSSPQQPRWRGGTMLQDATESQQRDFDKGTPLFWDDGNAKMQICATVQTTETDNGDFDDGVRVIYIKKNGSAPGSMFGEFKRAVAKAGGGFGTGCQIYFALVGTEPSKKKGGRPRRIFICHFVPMPPPGDAMLSGPEPGQQPAQQQPPVQQAQQPQWQGQPAPQQYQQAPPMQQPAYAQAGPPAQNGQQPQWQGQPAPQQGPPPAGPPAQPQGQPQWQGQPPTVQQAPPQWQGQPAIAQQGPPVAQQYPQQAQQPQWQGQPPASDSPFVQQQGPAPVQSPAPPQQPQWQQAPPQGQQQPPWPQQ
jgi:hypothetical protein